MQSLAWKCSAENCTKPAFLKVQVRLGTIVIVIQIFHQQTCGMELWRDLCLFFQIYFWQKGSLGLGKFHPSFCSRWPVRHCCWDTIAETNLLNALEVCDFPVVHRSNSGCRRSASLGIASIQPGDFLVSFQILAKDCTAQPGQCYVGAPSPIKPLPSNPKGGEGWSKAKLSWVTDRLSELSGCSEGLYH